MNKLTVVLTITLHIHISQPGCIIRHCMVETVITLRNTDDLPPCYQCLHYFWLPKLWHRKIRIGIPEYSWSCIDRNMVRKRWWPNCKLVALNDDGDLGYSGSAIDLLPAGAKLLPNPMLIQHHYGPGASMQGLYYKNSSCQSVNRDWNMHVWTGIHISQRPLN